MKQHPMSSNSPGLRAAYVIGYQECLRDIAEKMVAEGARGAATWISDNYLPGTEHVRATVLPNPALIEEN